MLGFDGTLVINPHVFSNFPIDVQKDLAPVPEQLGEQIRVDLEKYGKVVKAAGIKAE